MATNNFKPFAQASGANVTSQADYEALAALLTGFQSGKASSAQINKALRQSSAIASVLAQFIADKSGNDVLDNGSTSTILTNLLLALKGNVVATNPQYFVDAGAANAIVITPSPVITALVDGQVFDIAVAAANTGAVTLKVNALTAYPLIGPVGALQGGEIGAAKGVIRVVWSAAKSSFLIVAQNTTGPQQVAPAAQSNQAVNLGQFTLLSGDSGYIKFPNGVILQWGSGSITGGGSASGTVTVSYPIAFPNNFFQAVACPRDMSGGTSSGMSFYANYQSGTTQLSTIKVSAVGSAIGSLSFRYFAIGN
ncbi:hypothetical protein [Pantoea sp. Seng]|uniref:gp53-like domain-containing protein n=1 Tax=Pantoea sp. Seng TaxID=2576761 RepID=UPI001F332E23|nr:hypothetical protein [Pantoea sp. Seng]